MVSCERRGGVKILISYFSRTGNTENLAFAIGNELEERGHSLEWEVIKPVVYYSWLREVARDFPRYLSIAFSLVSDRWMEHHIRTYNQVEEDIQPLMHPDVSEFDRICIGGPKWGQISYPIARYIQIVRGIRGKTVGSFTTFGGPPLQTFEIDLIHKPMARLLGRMGAECVAMASVTSGYHEASLMPLFRLVSRYWFGKPIEQFMIGSEHANTEITKFCTELLGKSPREKDTRTRSSRSRGKRPGSSS